MKRLDLFGVVLVMGALLLFNVALTSKSLTRQRGQGCEDTQRLPMFLRRNRRRLGQSTLHCPYGALCFAIPVFLLVGSKTG